MSPRFHDWESLGIVKVGRFSIGFKLVFGLTEPDYTSRNEYRWRCRHCGLVVWLRSEAMPRRFQLEKRGVDVVCPRTRWERLLDDASVYVKEEI